MFKNCYDILGARGRVESKNQSYNLSSLYETKHLEQDGYA